MHRVLLPCLAALAACGGGDRYHGSTDYLTAPAPACDDLAAVDQPKPWTVWQAVPEFAGVILDSHFVHSIRMTEVRDTDRLWTWYPTDSKFVQVQFSWGELVRLKCQMSPTMGDPDAASLDADEATNRVSITVTSEAAAERVRSYADAHANPRDAVVVSIGEGVSF